VCLPCRPRRIPVLFHTCEADWRTWSKALGRAGSSGFVWPALSCGPYSAQNEASCGPAVRRPLLPRASSATAWHDARSCAVCARHSALPRRPSIPFGRRRSFSRLPASTLPTVGREMAARVPKSCLRFHAGVHLSPGHINQLPLRIDERLRGLARQL